MQEQLENFMPFKVDLITLGGNGVVAECGLSSVANRAQHIRFSSYDTPDNAIGYAMQSSRSHRAVVRVYEAGRPR